MLVSTFCLCWFERSRRKTIKEILPELRQTDPAVVREIGKLLIIRKRRGEEPPAPRLELARPPPEQLQPPDQAVS